MHGQGGRGHGFGTAVLCGIAFALAMTAVRAAPSTPAMQPEIPDKFETPMDGADYAKRDEMVPMRDGVKLHTVILIPKTAKRAPIILTRTPYDASKRGERNRSLTMAGELPIGDDVFVEDGNYIRVFQDVRGKYGSEGDYVMNRPLRGPLNSTSVDHATDAFDTIDWLVKNLPQSNGRVGMIGSSYEGFTVLMALIDPHPALKAAVPMSPMVDGWRGDDWFHNGAFRQVNFSYFHGQTTKKAKGDDPLSAGYDDYDVFRRAGSAGDWAHGSGADQLPFFRKLSEHPAYDTFWQEQAVDKLLGARPLKVPTMLVAPLWDQEDSYGAIHVYRQLEAKDPANDMSFLVMGPWRHSGVNYDGSSLGPLHFDGDTARQFRRDVMKPFLDEHLKDGAPKANTPPVLGYETGSDRWQRLKSWPLSCESGCAATAREIYLQPGYGLGFDKPVKTQTAYDEYVSDPAKPVPFVPRPVRMEEGDVWKPWLVTDQRAVTDRTDVLTYFSTPLTEPMKVAGTPKVKLVAATSGTDADWVVKLIDVYPPEFTAQPALGGYELPLSMDIFRGRYRESLDHPVPLKANAPLDYAFDLPEVNHVFARGHRIAVQIQSSWFPLYDRNPQTFVPNIFFAKPGDYRAATQRIYRSADRASGIELPVAPLIN